MRETTHRSAFDAIFPARVYTVERDTGAYSITVVDYRESERIHSERTDRTEANSSSSVWVTDVRASVAHAAQGFRTRGGEVTYDAWADIDKIEGHQLQITNPDGSRSFIGIHLHASRLYILEATVPPGAPPPGSFSNRWVSSMRRADGFVTGSTPRATGPVCRSFTSGSASILRMLESS